MIRFQCPKCDKRLGVNESQAGGIGVCPGCKSKFRIPQSQDDEIERPVQKASRPTRADDEPSPVRRRRRIEDDENERPSSDYEDEEPRPARKRKRKRRKVHSDLSFGLDGFTIALIGLGVVALIFLGMSLIWPATFVLSMSLGWLLTIVGGLWFLSVAFRDNPIAGVLCMFVPFYSLYYLVTHFEEVKQPFFVQLLGFVLLMVSSCTGGLSA